MTTAKNHKGILEEIKGLSPDIDGVDYEAPPHIALAIAARLRQQLRNSAQQTLILQRLARKRGDSKEAQNLGKQLDRFVRDIAELDAMYPGARDEMVAMDRAAEEARAAAGE